MPQAHRDGDKRKCTALTEVRGQTTVYVNEKLWSVVGDPNDHGAGNLIGLAAGNSVHINGIKVIVHAPDPAFGDNQTHPASQTITDQGSPNVYAYG